MRCLSLGSLLTCLLFAGCSSNYYHNLEKVETPAQLPVKSIFEHDLNSFLFKTKVSYKDEYYSGLLMIKEMDYHLYRMVLTTELGPKIFDLEFNNQEFIAHYCFEPLNRPLLLNLIEKDMRLLLMNYQTVKIEQAYRNKTNSITIYKTETNQGGVYYYVDDKSSNLAQLETSEKGRKKVGIIFDHYKNGFPYKISIDHGKLPLDLQLNLIER